MGTRPSPRAKELFRAAIASVGIAAAGIVAVAIPESPSSETVQGTPSAFASPCEATALPTMGGRGGNVVDVSSNGLLTGIADDGRGEPHVVVWRQGRITSLDVDLESAVPTAINSHGVVVGTGFDPATARRVGWAWVHGRLQVLDAGDAEAATPEDLDDSGRVVGAVWVAENEHAAVWSDLGSAPRLLPPAPGDGGSHAFAVAPDGSVGGASLGDGGTPVVWAEDGQVRPLETATGLGMVTGFGADAAPVGETYLEDGRNRAVVWDAQGEVSDLAAAGRGGSSAAVEGAGRLLVAGTASTRAGARPQAMVWYSPNGVGQTLAPVSSRRFHGVAGVVNGAVKEAGGALLVGYSADAVGLRVPTEWRCSP